MTRGIEYLSGQCGMVATRADLDVNSVPDAACSFASLGWCQIRRESRVLRELRGIKSSGSGVACTRKRRRGRWPCFAN